MLAKLNFIDLVLYSSAYIELVNSGLAKRTDALDNKVTKHGQILKSKILFIKRLLNFGFL